jgi:hypothetical protein
MSEGCRQEYPNPNPNGVVAVRVFYANKEILLMCFRMYQLHAMSLKLTRLVWRHSVIGVSSWMRPKDVIVGLRIL